MKYWKHTLASAAAAATLIAMPHTGHAQSTVTVVEYVNVLSNVRFITGRADEQAILDGLPQTFKRSGSTFAARPAAAASGNFQAVCRYRIDITSGYSTHFYGLPADCALIQDLVNRNVITNFFYEGLDFAVESAVNGSCPSSSPVPIRRALRLGTQIDVVNHRYATTIGDYQDALVQGWEGENVVFCSQSASAEAPREAFLPISAYQSQCAVPRTGVSPLTGNPYPDRPGTLEIEKQWLRSYFDQTYLWWREVPSVSLNNFATPQALLPALRAPTRIPSGSLKDKFSNLEPTVNAEQRALGRVFGYGFQLFITSGVPPRAAAIGLVDPGSPAAVAGLKRGDRPVRVNGVDFVNSNDQASVNTLNRALFPTTLGDANTFEFAPADGGPNKLVTLAAADLEVANVPQSQIIQTPTGRVGYVHLVTFGTFTAEKSLADAIAGLIASGGVSDLILDLRYNRGGLIQTSAQLAYMIAGPSATAGKVFSTLKQNEKNSFGPNFVYTFNSTGSGRAGGVAAGVPLPSLNLRRVFVITTGSTASASEGVISGLRGIDVEVIVIGQTTFGKPVGQYTVENCGLTMNVINFVGLNQKGEANYFDGFAPTCTATDDLTRQLGDPNERMLAAALYARNNGACLPASNGVSEKSDPVRTLEDDSDMAIKLPSWMRPSAIAESPNQVPKKSMGQPISPRKPYEVSAHPLER